MATLDTTTAGEYSALYNASDRASLIVSALSGTVTVNVYDGTGTVVGTGTMASPWATSADDTVVIGSVNGFAVTSTGTPDDNWYLRFVSGSRYVQFTFGLLGSGKEAVWSRSDWTAGTQAGIRNSVITVSGNVPPVFSVAPTSASLSSSGGTIQFTATDANDDTLTYSLASRYLSSITINSSTGLVTVPASAAGTSGSITVRASDGTLTADATCAVTVESAASTSTPHFIIPSSVSTWNAAVAQPRVSGGTAIPNSISGVVIELSAGTSTSTSSPGTRGALTIQNLAGSSGNRATVRNPIGGTVTISSASSFLFQIDDCSHVNFDFSNGITYGLAVECASSTSAVTCLVKFTDFNSNVTLKNFSIDGKRTTFSTTGATPIGLQAHDNTLLMSAYPGQFQQQNVVIENFYIRRVKGEGIYAGPNFSTAALSLRNMTIRNGLIEDTGRDAIQVKCWWEGTNSIHGIVGRRIGLNSNDEAGQRFGVSVLSGQADVYDINIDGVGESGIQLYTQSGPDSGVTFNGFGPYTSFVSRVYNVVIANSGQIDTGTVNTGHGITVGTDGASRVKTTPKIFNCTVVNCEGYGVNIGTAGAGFVRNNVLVGNGSGAYSLGSGGTTQAYNTTSATLAADYRLTSEIAATGTIGVDISATDIEGTSRVGTASRGAYEYSA